LGSRENRAASVEALYSGKKRRCAMSLIPWKSKQANGGVEVAPLAVIRDEMNRLFDNVLREPLGNLERMWGELGAWTPAVDVNEAESEITVRAELPGVAAEDLRVSIQNETLVLAGEKKEESTKQENGFVRSERRFGSFRREIGLPVEIDPEKVQAEFHGGVLTVKLRKTKAAKPHRIAVKTV
jgi:HSP20 family protein